MSVGKLFRFALASLVLASAITAVAPQSARAQDNKLTIWTKFNADNPQVASDRWLQKVIADYQTDKGVALENTFVAYNEINTRLNVAVTAGGQVPDVSYVDSANVGFYSNNGTLVDLTAGRRRHVGDVAGRGAVGDPGAQHGLLGGRQPRVVLPAVSGVQSAVSRASATTVKLESGVGRT